MHYLKYTTLSRLLFLLPAAFLLISSGQAFAQVGAAPIPAPADDAAEATAQQATPVEAAPVVKKTSKRSKDESIYILQERTYSKRGKFEVTPAFFTSLNNKFVILMGAGFSGAYHLRENFALEFTVGLPVYHDYSGLVYDVYEYESLTPEVVDLKFMKWFASANLQFSALYGKFTSYGYLIDYDFYISGGYGLTETLDSCPNAGRDECSEAVGGSHRGTKAPDDFNDRFKIAANIAGGARFFFSDRLGLKVEVRDVVYSDRALESGEVTTDIRNNVLFFLGLSFLL